MYGIFTYIWLIFMVNVGIYHLVGGFNPSEKYGRLDFQGIHISYHKTQIKAPCLNICIRNIRDNFFMICLAYTIQSFLHILHRIHMSKLVLAVFGKQLGGATVHHTLLTSR